MHIVSCAGSGKTETLSARIVRLLTSGVRPEEIVAFTFTERAADEMLRRIRTKAESAVKKDPARSSIYFDLPRLRCSTMHSFCFHLLRDVEPRFNTYEIFTEHQEYALILRCGVSLGLSGSKSSLKYNNDIGITVKDEIEVFLASLDVIYNELIDDTILLQKCPKFLQAYQKYRALLDRQRIISFGLIIREAVEHLEPRQIENHPLRHIKYLFVDEYQDTNTAQEHLIEQFARVGAEICVVGDDDQCIYQWRGSNVDNFLNFSKKYKAEVYELPENRRCQPMIFEASRSIASNIRKRKKKTMVSETTCPPLGIARLRAKDDQHEARLIVKEIKSLLSKTDDKKYSRQEIAILLRSVATSAQHILAELSKQDIAFRVIGSTALLERPGVDVIARLFFAWAEVNGVGPGATDGTSWREEFSQSLEDFVRTYLPSRASKLREIEQQVLELGRQTAASKRPDVVKALTQILAEIGVNQINPDTGQNPGLLCDIGSMTNLVTDVQAAFLRNLAECGFGDGTTLINDIAWFIVRYASSEYEANLDFDPSLVDAVSVCTVHQTKGLQWPVVIIPSLVEGRFPPEGRGNPRFIPGSIYPQKRYDVRFIEDEDPERRLFYVAVTRARERLILSDFEKIKRSRQPSPFYNDIPQHCFKGTDKGFVRPEVHSKSEQVTDITCSELVDYVRCPHFYRLRRMWDWRYQLPEELGYAISLHHLANMAARNCREIRKTPARLDELVDREFHMPYAPHSLQNRMKERAKVAIRSFHTAFRDDLERVRMAEEDLVFTWGGVRINCRPDLIIDLGDSKKWVIDLKNIKSFKPQPHQQFQIRAYALGLESMGLNTTRGSFYNFDDGTTRDVAVDPDSLRQAERVLTEVIEGIKSKVYIGKREPGCTDCDYGEICFYLAAN